MHKDVQEILISEAQIKEKSKALGAIISEDYKDSQLLLVGLLKGSVPFMAELIKHINLDIQLDFMDVSSYVGTESHEIRIEKDITRPIAGWDILIVEDIVDTGKTLQMVKQLLENRKAKSVKIITLLDKPEGRLVEVEVDYVGFTIPKAFVIGFGLDFDEKYRNLPYVGILKASCYR